MKVYSIGETVLDIIFKDNQPVSATPGGSVLNTSVSLGRLGIPVHFISDYGKDQTGVLIDTFLEANHVNTDKVVRYERFKSSLALAFLDNNNDASYSFYKDFPKERLKDIRVEFSDEDYLIFGSFFAISESVREGVVSLLKEATMAGATIIYDPNFRKPHLHELNKVKPRIIQNISYASMVKGSDMDFRLIFGVSSAQEAYAEVKEAGCEYLFYTSGDAPVHFFGPGIELSVPVPEISPVSTVGAGDNFTAGLVYGLLKRGFNRGNLFSIGYSEWTEIIKTGISFSSNVCKSYTNYISEEFALGTIKNQG